MAPKSKREASQTCRQPDYTSPLSERRPARNRDTQHELVDSVPSQFRRLAVSFGVPDQVWMTNETPSSL